MSHPVLSSRVEKYFGENKPHAGLGRQSLHSGVAFLFARGLNIVVQVGSTILLARLLNPQDYGLVAMVFALIGFGPMLIDFGTTDATVQKPRITPAEASALFWLKVAIGGTLALLVAGGSEFIAAFYGESTLTGIAIASSLTLIMAALSSQHFALMRRAMQFKHIAVIDITSNAVSSIIAIGMALTGWGYWALVAKPILMVTLSAVAAWVVCPWVPGRPRYCAGSAEMVRFGLGVTGFTMTDYWARSADRISIGYFYGAGSLGYFQNAFLLYDNVLSVFTQLHDVAVASLSKLRSDLGELKRSWAAALSSLTFFSAGGFAVLAVTAEDLVVLLLGQKWTLAGPLVCIFAIKGIAHVTERSLGWLHVAAGRPDRWMRWGIFSAICQLAAVLAGVPFGLIGIAVAHAAITFCLFVPALAYAGQPVGIGARDVLRAVGPQTVAALCTVAAGYLIEWAWLGDLSRLTRFLVGVPMCLTIYLVLAAGVFRVTAPLYLAFSVLRDFIPFPARLRRSP
jgi:PST family polysaccharide transporter